MWQAVSAFVVCLFLYSVGAAAGARWFRGADPAPGGLDLVLLLLLWLSRIPLRHLPLTPFSQKAGWAALVLLMGIAVHVFQGRTSERRILPQ